jgi:hypothetical protein
MKMEEIPHAAQAELPRRGSRSGTREPQPYDGLRSEVLRQGGDGIGRTRTSKLIAAKRPRLIPIWDSFVEQATGLATLGYWWRFKQVLIADDRAIWNWLGELRPQATNVPRGVSELRMLDVLLWMTVEGSGGTQTAGE